MMIVQQALCQEGEREQGTVVQLSHPLLEGGSIAQISVPW